MSSIRTQFTHKSVMLGICFLGMLLNSRYEAWSSPDAEANHLKSPSIEAKAKQSQQNDSLEAKKEEAEVSMACFG